MLKIKDNVDLKELQKICKKYGKINKLYNKYTGSKDGYALFLKKVGNYGEWFELKSGVLEEEHKKGYYDSFTTYYYHSEMVYLLYDLIKADLVEKSDGNE